MGCGASHTKSTPIIPTNEINIIKTQSTNENNNNLSAQTTVNNEKLPSSPPIMKLNSRTPSRTANRDDDLVRPITPQHSNQLFISSVKPILLHHQSNFLNTPHSPSHQNYVNHADPSFFASRIKESFAYYAHSNEDEAMIDKKGFIELANDCVRSCITSLTNEIKKQNSKWDDVKVQSKVKEQKPKYLPGSNEEATNELIRHYLSEVFNFKQNKGVSFAGFCRDFPRTHTLMFSTKLSIEREQIIEKLNKREVEKTAKGEGLTSIRHHRGKSNEFATKTGNQKRQPFGQDMKSKRNKGNMFDLDELKETTL